MQPDTQLHPITEDYLKPLDTDQLIDLLLHRTNLFLAVAKNKVVDLDALNVLGEDVKKIQSALQERRS